MHGKEIKPRFISRKQEEAYLKKGYHIELIDFKKCQELHKSESAIAIELTKKYRDAGRSAHCIQSGTRIRGIYTYYVFVK